MEENKVDDSSIGGEVRVQDCEEALNKVKSGKYQIVAFLLLTICYTCTGSFITNSFIFLEKDPPIKCYKEINGTMTSFDCSRKDACDVNSEYVKYEFEYITDSSYSWTNDFKLGCKDDYLVAMLISLFFIGSMISSLISSTLSDFLGRAKLIKFAMLLRCVFILIPILVRNVYVVLGSMFFLGILNSMHSTIPYILLSEYLSKDERDNYLTLMFICESFSGIISTLFFFLLQNWVIFFIFNFCYGLIFVVFSFLLHESPRFLYSNKRYEEAREVIKKISSFNSGKPLVVKFEKENEIDTTSVYNQLTSEKISFTYIFKNPNFRKYILVLPLIWCLDAFAFFAINFMIKYLKVDIYLLNTIVFVSECVSYLISNLAMTYLGKRNCMISAFAISGVSFFLFYFLHSEGNLVLIIALTFLAKFGASVVLNVSSIYTNESFPTQVRGRATAVCSFLGKFGGIIAPFLVEMSPLTGLVSGSSCVLAALILLPLENRHSKVQFNDEQEVEKDNKGGEIEEDLLANDKLDNIRISTSL